MRTLIQMVLEQGVTPEIRTLLQNRLDGPESYIARAQHGWHRDGEVEVDDDAIVKRGCGWTVPTHKSPHLPNSPNGPQVQREEH